MTFYNLVVFYYLVELFPTRVTIPKASRKMAKSQGQYFQLNWAMGVLDICLQSVNDLKIPTSLMMVLLE